MTDLRKIALITAHGWVGISTPVIMTARYLAQRGYLVDLFMDQDRNCHELGIDVPTFKESGIRIITFSGEGASQLPADPLRKIDPRDRLFAERVRMLPDRYAWLVGFDPHGLIRAGLLAEQWQIPFIYHSLEIYPADDDLKRLEQLFSRQALLSVTQDQARADILSALTGMPRDRVRIVYNSSLGEVTPEKRGYFREKFGLPPEAVVVLATGTLLPITCVDSLIRSAPLWPAGFVLVLHGWIPDPLFKEFVLRACATHPDRIFLSTEIVAAEQKSILFQSADLGLVFYSADDINLAYAAGSAGKLYDFMQAGVPVIANDIPGMRELVEGNGIGLVVTDASGIAATLPVVADNYQQMRAHALQSFGNYSFEKSFTALMNEIEGEITAADAIGNQTMNHQSPAALKAQASARLEAGQLQEAFDLLITAKGLKEPVQGVDLLRAHCFLRMGQPLGAVEALREEIRFFPDHGEAARLLEELQGEIPAGAYGSCGMDNTEFRELLATIRPYTMLSEQRLYSLYSLARSVCERDLPGNFVECGVAAGGSSALLAFVVKKYSRQPRRLFSFDSFSGMPKPSALDSHQGIEAESTGWGTGTCAAPEQSLREVCAKLGVSELVTAVKGYFEETLPELRDWVGMVALLHLDGDWYSSTKAILDNLYDRLMNDALLQVDDYGYWDGCRKALHEFEAARGVKFSINQIDGTGVWFTKPDGFPINSRIPQELVEDFRLDDPAPKGVSSQMSMNERFQLYYALRQELPKSGGLTRFVEIGSYSGASLLLTHQALQRQGIRFQGICVEPGGTAQFHEIVKLLSADVIHLPVFSHEAARRLAAMVEPQRLPQFIFVDGDHTYQGVLQDILDFYPLLAPGGIMLFHDYLPALDQKNSPFILNHHGNQEPGIRQACQELMEESYGCELIELPLLYPSDPTQTQPQLPIIPGVFSTVRAYRKPVR